MSRRKILVADLLCGAGGSITGCEQALLELGFLLEEIEFVGVNHWPTAIETLLKNHARVRAFVQDIATVRPHILVPEGYLDLLMASPTCTHHSNARGGKPTSDQQRSDPWHIITWLTELRVKRIIIENVWEFVKWGPVNAKTGKPIKSREGEYFWAWINALKACGFTKLEWRKLNAADYGDATTRQRFILMGRSDGKPVHFPMPTHAKRPDEGLALFPTLQPWRPAREIIDWGIRGRSIFNRDRDLAPKTISRIYAGAVKNGWPDPFLVILRNHMAARGLELPVPSIAANGQHIGLAEPVLINLKKGAAPRTTADALHAQTAEASHLGLAEPFVLSQHSSGAARSSEEPLPTIMTGGAGAADHPGCARPALIEPFVATVAHGNSPDDATADSRRVHSVDGPLGAFHAGGGKFAVIEPFVLSQASGGAARGVSNPIPTQTTGGAGGAHALISPYYGAGSGETCTTTDDVLPTATSKARFGLVVPVTNGSGGPEPRSTDEQIPTMTTAKGGEFALVMPVTHQGGANRARDVDGEPLPTVTGANRGDLAFITAQHGERPGQAPRTHSVDAPTPTVAATGHVDLVEGVAGVEGLAGYDILFRMLEPHELAAAMGFTTEAQAYEFAGTKTEQIKQIGNAVSVRKMKACVGAIMADAAPKRRTSEPRHEVAA